MLTSSPTSPNQAHWNCLSVASYMEPEEFLKHWDVTYKELAEICHCSEDTVKHWFSTSSRRPPQSHHKALLAMTNVLWNVLEDSPAYVRHIYDKVKDRKKPK